MGGVIMSSADPNEPVNSEPIDRELLPAAQLVRPRSPMWLVAGVIVVFAALVAGGLTLVRVAARRPESHKG